MVWVSVFSCMLQQGWGGWSAEHHLVQWELKYWKNVGSNNVTIFIISSWSIISAQEFGTSKIKHFTLVRVQGERQTNLHLICPVMNPKHFLEKSRASPLHHHYYVINYFLDTRCAAERAQSLLWLYHGQDCGTEVSHLWQGNAIFPSPVSKPTIQSHQMGDSTSLPYVPEGWTWHWPTKSI